MTELERLQEQVKECEALIQAQDAERELLVMGYPATRLAYAANFALNLCQIPVKLRTPTGLAKLIDSLGWSMSTEGQKNTETHSNERKPTDS